MPRVASVRDVEILPFSEKWLEGILDLLEKHRVIDPLFGKDSTREEEKTRILWQISQGITKAFFVAVKGRVVVGTAKANIIPTCGEDEKGMAWLSLTISLDHIGQGIGARLVERIREEMKSQGVKLLRIGMMDSWQDWCGFLKRCGFKPKEEQRTADAMLPPNIEIPAIPPEANEVIRPIRLPWERQEVLDFAFNQLAQDLPYSCAPRIGQEAWWEKDPSFDPSGFFVAEDKDTGKIVGFVISSVFKQGNREYGLIISLDVAKNLVGTNLRDRLVSQATKWLRGKGVLEIRYRVHIGYRDEEETFKRLRFNLTNSASIWYKTT